jgi:starch synthase
MVLAASEVVGFAKTGGLADVAAALPRALARRGHECSVVLPLYRTVRTGRVPVEATGLTFEVPVGTRTVGGAFWRARLPDSDVPVYLVEHADYFERDDPAAGRGLYQFTLPGGQKRDYPDNCERFVFFCRAVLEALRHFDLRPDVLHVNDWQTGLVPVYLKEVYAGRDGFERVRTLFTIHNVAYQGLFWHWDVPLTGLDWRLFNYHQLEFHGHLNFLKAGIAFADWLNTVSPTYAREIQTPYFGCGLEGALSARKDRLTGIVNGVEYRTWDPAHDPRLAANYDADTVTEGKPKCKAALQRRFGLPEQPGTPLLGMVARLVEQKGVGLVGRAVEGFLQQGAQLVVLGEGDAVYHRMLTDLKARHADKVGLALVFDEGLAHQVEAGSDVFLMPSQYEPSGLNQLYSLKYGAVPVVRATGGLADTIVDATPAALADGTATGFAFGPHTPAGLREALQRALDMYRHHPDQWLQLVRTGMRQDWSWDRVAVEYEKLYARMTNAQ